MKCRLTGLGRRSGLRLQSPQIGLHFVGPDGSGVAATRNGFQAFESGESRIPPRSNVWLTNLSLCDMLQFGLADERRHILPNCWLGLDWRQLLAEWGLGTYGPPEQMQALASAVSRSVDLAVAALAKIDPDFEAGIVDYSIFRQHSLASALRSFVRTQLGATRPTQQAMLQASKDLHLFGTRGPPQRDAEKLPTITFVRNRAGHVKALARRRTPLAGRWKLINLPKPGAFLDDELFDALDSLGRPVAVAGAFEPYEFVPPTWVWSWLAGGSGSYGRQHFMLEEAGLLRQHGSFRIQHAFAGPGWRTARDSLLHRTMKHLSDACGFAALARLSWSAGLAAQNVLESVAGMPDDFRNYVPLESCWLAMHDRMDHLAAVSEIDSSGAILIGIRGGTLRVGVRAAARTLPDLVPRLGALGWWPLGCPAAGVDSELPSAGDCPDNVEQRAVVLSMQAGLDAAAGQIDRLLDLPASRRRVRLKELRRDLVKGIR